MATLTLNQRETTRSTRIDLVSRPRPAAPMALSVARDEVIVLRQAQHSALRQAQHSVVGRRRGVLGQVSGHPYALTMPCGPSNGLSQCDIRLAAAINDQSKSTKSIDEGFNAAHHNGMGAFVSNLGSRPPSPPV